jgi:hypothetical protein
MYTQSRAEIWGGQWEGVKAEMSKAGFTIELYGHPVIKVSSKTSGGFYTATWRGLNGEPDHTLRISDLVAQYLMEHLAGGLMGFYRMEAGVVTDCNLFTY